MAKFTVLGASGFIGGELAARLVDCGHEVFRPTRSELRSLSGRKLGHIFYCLGVQSPRENPYGAFETHIAYLAYVLKSCSFSSLTYLSSTRLYLGAPTAREDEAIQILPADRDATFNAMKIVAEQLCLAFDKPTVRFARVSNVVGFAPNGTSLIPALVKDAIKYGKINLTISPQSSKDYIAIDDVCDLLPRIAIEGKQQCYNLASGSNIELSEIAELVCNEFSSACKWQSSASTVIFPTIDISRVRAEFSFAPRSARNALISAFAQYRRHWVTPVATEART